MVRQRASPATRFSRIGDSRSVHHHLAVRKTRLRLSHAIRIREHLEVRRRGVRFAVAGVASVWVRLHGRPRKLDGRHLRLRARAAELSAHSRTASTLVLPYGETVAGGPRPLLEKDANL